MQGQSTNVGMTHHNEERLIPEQMKKPRFFLHSLGTVYPHYDHITLETEGRNHTIEVAIMWREEHYILLILKIAQ